MDFTNIGLSLLITALLVLFIASVMHAAKKLAGSAQKSAEKSVAEEIFRVPNGRAEYRNLVGRTVRYRKSRKALRRGAKEFGKAELVGSGWRYRGGRLCLVAKLKNEVGTILYRYNFEVA